MPPCRAGEKLVPAHVRKGYYRKRRGGGSTARRQWVRPCKVRSTCRRRPRTAAQRRASTARRRARKSSVTLDATGSIGDGFRYVAHQRGSPSFARHVGIVRATTDFCKGGVRGAYVRGPVLDKADVVMVAYDERPMRGADRKRKVAVGFAAVNLRGKYGLQVDVLCSRGHGRKLLRAVEETARRMGRRHVVLYAMPQVINFYRRCGYRHALAGEQESRRVAKLADDALRCKKRSLEGAMADARVRKLMHALVREGLVYKKNCVGIEVNAAEYETSCSTDGYYMRKAV